MEKLTIVLKGIESEFYDLDDMTATFSDEIDKNVNISKIKSFSGLEDVIIILSIGGGGVVIKQIASIINNYILRNAKKKIKAKNIEITGYSAKDVIEILKEYSDDI